MLSDWRTRWGPRVSESPVEEWEILFSLFYILYSDAGSPTRVSVFSLFQDIISGCTPLHHEENPYKIQTTPGYYYKTDELLRCFNKIREATGP
ncbi:hypothetical protein TNCV_205001 [Trichonephila clavipes]|nr:hypothetical protein TNCV_205001 [Trichonephila clavipes]